MTGSFIERTARSVAWIMWLGRGLFFTVVLLLLVMRSVVTAIRIDGHSMDPTLQDGQWVFVDLISKYSSGWNKGDVVILRFPGDPIHSIYVKRIIGVPGDKISIENGKVFRNGTLLDEHYVLAGMGTSSGVVKLPEVVPEDKYIVFGDNREISNDSRYFGLVPKSELIGKVILGQQ